MSASRSRGSAGTAPAFGGLVPAYALIPPIEDDLTDASWPPILDLLKLGRRKGVQVALFDWARQVYSTRHFKTVLANRLAKLWNIDRLHPRHLYRAFDDSDDRHTTITDDAHLAATENYNRFMKVGNNADFWRYRRDRSAGLASSSIHGSLERDKIDLAWCVKSGDATAKNKHANSHSLRCSSGHRCGWVAGALGARRSPRWGGDNAYPPEHLPGGCGGFR